MEVEGLVLQTVDYQERDLVVKLLGRNGKKYSLFVYGGQGGGKNKKSKLYQLGSLLRIELQRETKPSQDGLKVVKSGTLLWQPSYLRYHAKGFYYLCFFLEVINKVAQEASSDEFSSEAEGLFNVLSNSIFYLDQASQNLSHDLSTHLFFFHAKLLRHLGLTPQTDYCVYCQHALSAKALLIFDEGGFSCLNCKDPSHQSFSDEIHHHLKQVYAIKYDKVGEFDLIPHEESKKLFHFLLFHTQLKVADFKTSTLVFKGLS